MLYTPRTELYLIVRHGPSAVCFITTQWVCLKLANQRKGNLHGQNKKLNEQNPHWVRTRAPRSQSSMTLVNIHQPI